MITVTHLTCEYQKDPMGVGADVRLSYQIASGEDGCLQSARRIQLGSPDLKHIVFDSGRVETGESVLIPLEMKLSPRTPYVWRVQVWDQAGRQSPWSEEARFETGLLDGPTARWISPSWEGDLRKPFPPTLFRHTFTLPAGVVRARAYASAHGVYQLSFNGKKVGEDYLTPGWTHYFVRTQVQTYDVTALCRIGENAVGLTVADGWYRGRIGFQDNRNFYGDRTEGFVELSFFLDDGRELRVGTGPDWKWSTGEVAFAELYDGERVDARLHKDGWDGPGYPAEGWKPVRCGEGPAKGLVPQQDPPARAQEILEPVRELTTPKGEKVLDMGQNLVGTVRIRLSGAKPGETVRLRFAEVLDAQGNFYLDNLRTAKQEFVYIARGDQEESYTARFTHYGFQYVRVDSWAGVWDKSRVAAIVLHADLPVTGAFSCSDPLVNQLQHNILWGQKGNFVDVPTDCPQRDERLGWTGDAQVFVRTACFNMNVASFFTKWLRDLALEQNERYGVPHVVPNVLSKPGQPFAASAAWGDAAVICPWTIYLCYGDRRLLREQYPSMKSWIAYIRATGEQEALWNTGEHFGDWLGLDAEEGSYKGATDEGLIATAYYAYSTKLTAQAAEALGEEADAKQYQGLHRRIVQAFQAAYAPGGQLRCNTQTAHVLALQFDLLPEQARPAAVQMLVHLLEDKDWHLTTGFVGTPYLCPVLTRFGRHDVAAKVFLKRDYPSWLYPVTQGATTMWEHWDGRKPDGSFWSADMNSFNHYAYGCIGEWLYRMVCGLETSAAAPGYRHSVLSPRPLEGLRFARAALDTLYGRLSCGWERQADGGMVIFATVPVNTTASLCYAGQAFALGSGEHRFTFTKEGVRA